MNKSAAILIAAAIFLIARPSPSLADELTWRLDGGTQSIQPIQLQHDVYIHVIRDVTNDNAPGVVLDVWSETKPYPDPHPFVHHSIPNQIGANEIYTVGNFVQLGSNGTASGKIIFQREPFK